MRDDYDVYDWRRIGEAVWRSNAEQGYIGLYGDAEHDWVQTVSQLSRRWLFVPETRPARVYVDIVKCGSGCAGSYHVARQLEKVGCETFADWEAGSAGLFMFMAGERRVCLPHTAFLFHGNLYRWMRSGATDEERAEWFAEKTNQPYEFWLDAARKDGPLSFGAEQALEWGVATEVVRYEL